MLAKNFSLGPKWFPGVIEALLGPLSYLIKLDDGYIIKRHINRFLNHIECKEPIVDDELPLGPTFTQETSLVVDCETSSNSAGDHNISTPETVTPLQLVECRYSQRQHKKAWQIYIIIRRRECKKYLTLFKAHYVSHVSWVIINLFIVCSHLTNIVLYIP